jgi:hypothetical protein
VDVSDEKGEHIRNMLENHNNRQRQSGTRVLQGCYKGVTRVPVTRAARPCVIRSLCSSLATRISARCSRARATSCQREALPWGCNRVVGLVGLVALEVLKVLKVLEGLGGLQWLPSRIRRLSYARDQYCCISTAC